MDIWGFNYSAPLTRTLRTEQKSPHHNFTYYRQHIDLKVDIFYGGKRRIHIVKFLYCIRMYMKQEKSLRNYEEAIR
jgi:hypothetical protein